MLAFLCYKYAWFSLTWCWWHAMPLWCQFWQAGIFHEIFSLSWDATICADIYGPQNPILPPIASIYMCFRDPQRTSFGISNQARAAKFNESWTPSQVKQYIDYRQCCLCLGGWHWFMSPPQPSIYHVVLWYMAQFVTEIETCLCLRASCHFAH